MLGCLGLGFGLRLRAESARGWCDWRRGGDGDRTVRNGQVVHAVAVFVIPAVEPVGRRIDPNVIGSRPVGIFYGVLYANTVVARAAVDLRIGDAFGFWSFIIGERGLEGADRIGNGRGAVGRLVLNPTAAVILSVNGVADSDGIVRLITVLGRDAVIALAVIFNEYFSRIALVVGACIGGGISELAKMRIIGGEVAEGPVVICLHAAAAVV